MGYMRHHAIIVSSFDGSLLATARQTALGIFAPCQVTGLVTGVVNQESSFMVGPDGSKEGWSDSYDGDNRRERFVTWLDANRYDDDSSALKWVEVQYGDDEGETRIVRDSDERTRANVPLPDGPA
jgi:hypothetical protein